MSRIPVLLAASLLTAGCAQLRDYAQCDDVTAERLALAPARLSATGLFADIQRVTLAEGVVPYRPEFELWSDGATKRRWIYLPPHTTIDTSDMDAWQFPAGTKLWKEFTRDGVRVETRLLAKVGDAADDWVMVAYVWNDDGSDAIATPGGLDDARGTPHDVPAARTCIGCHGGTQSRVLGVSAIQLAGDRPDGELSLDRLTREDRISTAPPPSLAVPGDPVAQQALGYLHANCAHCHNQHRPVHQGARCFDPRTSFDLSLRTDQLGRLDATPVYATAVGHIVTPGAPDDSDLYERFMDRVTFAPRMPALGTETIDRRGASLLRTWIENLHR